MRVDSRPSYLTREAVDDTVVAAFPDNRTEHPLVVKNTNLIEPPYGDVTSSLLDSLLGLFSDTERTSLHAAADALQAVEQAADRDEINATLDPTYRDERKQITGPPEQGVDSLIQTGHKRLKGKVTRGIIYIEEEIISILADYDLGDEDSREAAVSEGLSRWQTTSGRALALTDGEGVKSITSAVLSRWGEGLSEGDRRRLRLELDWIVQRAREKDGARPAAAVVDSVDNRVQEEARRQLEAGINDKIKHAAELEYKKQTGKALSTFPKGVPVAPPPLPWITTVNFWFVEASGEYPRFTVRTPTGSADRPGGDLVYVRDNSTVRLDITGDDATERVGSTERIIFNTSADIAVAVPPGPRGVGDVDGRQTETSPGWPRPGRPEEDNRSTIYP
jgi:F0F1-type ATP synthase epsilon subunit